jgi:hypothetical protein
MKLNLYIFFLVFLMISCGKPVNKMEKLLMNEKGWRAYKAGPVDSLKSSTFKMVDMDKVRFTYYFKSDHIFEVYEANDGKDETGKWQLKDSMLTLSFSGEGSLPVKIVSINHEELIWDQLGYMRVHLKPVQ